MKETFETDGDYLVFLGRLADLFSDLYTTYSKVGRARALEELSDVFQVQRLVDDPELFFITPAAFLASDFGLVEDFLNEKFGLVILFVRRVLYQRQVELGIYSTPDEYDESVVVDEAGRSKLKSDLGVLTWFLNFSFVDEFEAVFYEEKPTRVGVLPPSGSETEMSVDEVTLYDNENRPLK